MLCSAYKSCIKYLCGFVRKLSKGLGTYQCNAMGCNGTQHIPDYLHQCRSCDQLLVVFLSRLDDYSDNLTGKSFLDFVKQDRIKHNCLGHDSYDVCGLNAVNFL
ncbi:MAG: hypothetical protein A4E58_01497 [Syntrophorhabdus sp. PtaB.Bin006]|nr:MAG: hypothetical protein A4E58_01497 [Syntrophorhabdus sp. PtaB.Bin006]